MGDDGVMLDDRQGAIDWAYSIQKRYAEALAADLVAVVQSGAASGAPNNTAHMLRVRAAMAVLGVDPSLSWTPPDPLHELDDAWVRGTFDPMVDRLRAALPPSEAAKLEKLVISSLPSGEVSALCATNTWDDFCYVFMDADLVMFCQLAAKVLAVCIDPMLDDKLAVTKVESRRSLDVAKSDFIANKVLDLYISSVVRATVRGAKPWIPSPRPLAASAFITEAMLMFVAAHELCHVLAGHFERGTGFANAVTGETAQSLAFEHEDEFEADGMGVMLALAALTREGSVSLLAAMAPYALLKFIEHLYDARAVFGLEGDAASSSHPPPAERAVRLRQVVVGMLGHDPVLDPMLTRIDQISFQMTRKMTPVLAQMAKAGIEPRRRRRLNPPGLERPAILGFQPSLADVAPQIAVWRERLGM